MPPNEHESDNVEAQQLGATEDGTVMLDIGGDVGALVLLTNESMHLAEIEISPLDENARDVFQWNHAHAHDHGHSHDHAHGHSHDHDGPPRTHVAVRERRGPGGSRYAAIYPGLREGSYQLWSLDGRPADVVHIVGGQVAEVDWR